MATEAPISLENFQCTICRDVYTDPVTIPCGNSHVSCRECVTSLVTVKDSKCPVCRTKLKSDSVHSATTVASQMQSVKVPCFGCNSKILVADMNQHIADCDRIDKTISYFKPVKETTQKVPTDLPNRSTFRCPYCKLSNLDTNGLRDHCNDNHRTNTAHVVCPICASMPWGNKNQTSSDFMQHLNMRHKFEYDTFVDYRQDDEAMLEAAIKASLENA